MKHIRFSDVTESEWNNWCSQISYSSLNHSYEYLKYNEVSYAVTNKSFAIYNTGSKDIIALCPIFVEEVSYGPSKYKSVSMLNSPVPAPAINYTNDVKEDSQRLRLVLTALDDFVKENEIKRLYFKKSPLAYNLIDNYFYYTDMIDAGFQPVIFNVFYIDLNQTQEKLFAKLSPSHRKRIKNSIKEGQQVKVIDCTNSPEEITKWFGKYKDAHISAVGRQTRPDISFSFMERYIHTGYGFLFINTVNDQPTSYLYCDGRNGLARGWSQANVKELEKKYSPRHLLEWEAIIYFHKKKFKKYEIGTKYVNGQFLYTVDEKLLNISEFKRRYGGNSAPEYYYEKIMDSELKRMIYISKINEGGKG